MSTVRQRKKRSSSLKKKKSSITHSSSSTKNSKPLIPLPIIFRLLIVTMFLFSIYIFKKYYLGKYLNAKSIINSNTNLEEIDLDFTKIINSEDLNLNKTKIKEISPRFSHKKKKKIPKLKMWNVKDFWTEEMALNISNQLYQEFMDEIQRNKSFYFAVNRGNEKIRGNDNIEQKIKDAHSLLNKNAFSYCKYEYRRELPLYQEILSYLNSSYVINIMSKLLKKDIVGVSDLFISIYYKDNFLSMHDDRGLGHYAFINFLSQNWDSDKNGGSLNFNCQERHNWKQSCLEIKPIFNQNVLFKVWPNSIPHFVKEVVVDKPRIAITGWYFTTELKGVHWPSIYEETGYGLI